MKSIDKYWMKKALILAKTANSKNEVPVGAVLIYNNKIISKGYNISVKKNDPTAHAEIITLRKGGYFLKNYRLLQTTLYVTLQPCLMCFGAILNSRIYKLVYGVNSNYYKKRFFNKLFINKKIKIKNNIFKEKCKHIIQQFFKKKRK
ncbi:tRNA adenosine(34) deaminase TadA [Buchnera aphidicola]|uniref:tRNA adenosine(34) deaminase TadA n=1 Tax=Buchnera aphidicola TaxID=9 RepID=UPI0031B7FDD5